MVKQAGRAHWLIVAGITSVLLVVGLFLFARDSAAETATGFMTALSKGDVDKLVELSYFDRTSTDELRKKWDFAVHRAGPHYLFAWRVENVSQADSENAAAMMAVTRNIDQEGFEEKFQLPLVKKDGSWKVDVRAINRTLFPALPR